MFQLRSIFIFAASAAMLSGMTARADGHREWTAQQAADSMPQQWAYTSDRFQSLPVADNWWQEFDDPTLTDLISRGIDNNFNVAIAARRMEMARQQIRESRAGYFPTIGLSAGWNASRTSGNLGSSSMPASHSSNFSLGADMSWEIDLFGRIGEQVKGSKAQFRASHADYLATMNSLAAEIASTYCQLRTLQARLAVAREHLQSQGRALKIAEVRHETGLVSKLDVAQARTIYSSTESTIPTLETSIQTAINALSLLVGEYPSAIAPLVETPQKLPDYLRLVAVGVPMDLLRRRPDIQAAEQQMAVAAAQAGVAKKDFLPVLSLTGSVGLASHNIGDLVDGRSFTYAIAPKLSWTVFDGLARNARLASARENLALTVDQYKLTLLTAVEEVDNAMVAYTGQIRSIASLETVVDQAREQMDLSLDQYKQGLEDFLSVAQAQITFLQYADQLTAARGEAMADLISLYKALGGGWSLE